MNIKATIHESSYIGDAIFRGRVVIEVEGPTRHEVNQELRSLVARIDDGEMDVDTVPSPCA